MKLKDLLRVNLDRIGINVSKNLGFTESSDIRKILNYLRPKFYGTPLIRIGGIRDGGYLIPDDLIGIKGNFSPGCDSKWDFERHLADSYGIFSHICDTEDKKPLNLNHMQDFTNKWIGPSTEANYVSLNDFILSKKYSDDVDLILQMDIEGAEYIALLATPESILRRFRIIVIEFHAIDTLRNYYAFKNIFKPLFTKLESNFYVAHSHPNNCCGVWNIGKFEFPRVIEVTFHRNDRMLEEGKFISTPHDLDIPCVENQKEISINWNKLKI